jgi:hypothetical protein
MDLFLKRSLSETLIKAPFILLLSFVINCIPFTNNLFGYKEIGATEFEGIDRFGSEDFHRKGECKNITG